MSNITSLVSTTQNMTNSNYDSNPSTLQREEWARVQTELKSELIEIDDFKFTKIIKEDNGEQIVEFKELSYIGGVDLSFEDNEEDAIASLVVLKYPSLEVIYEDFLPVKLKLPYIAGFLAFREVTPLLDLLQNLKKTKPDIFPQVIIVDGNGKLHPRRFGLASHLGVLADVPTIGVGKNFLQIDDDGENLTMAHVKATVKEKLKKGGDAYFLQGQSGTIFGAVCIKKNARIIGEDHHLSNTIKILTNPYSIYLIKAVRSRDNVKNPIFVSVGHKISLETSIQIVLKCCRYRIPEPTRQADIRSRDFIRNNIPQ